jgi:uncharacterized protein YeaO (DUF488 family)
MVTLKRAYEPASRGDGYRVLVDRLWPRGVTKDLPLDEWAKQLAPTAELRSWFGHQPERWSEFARRYRRELSQPDARRHLAELADRAATQRVTLIFAARDRDHNNAVVLRAMIDRLLAARKRRTSKPRRGGGPSLPRG